MGYDNGRPYLVMEYLRGCNLRQQTRQRRPAWRQSAGWTAKLARRVKRIKLATNIVPILDNFEASGWPPDIASPFTDMHAGRRIKDAVASLNEGLSGMRFYASADETRVCWLASRAETQ